MAAILKILGGLLAILFGVTVLLVAAATLLPFAILGLLVAALI